MSRTEVAMKRGPPFTYEPDNVTALDQVAPPSSEWNIPGVWTSNGSPRPSKSESGAAGFMAMLPTESEPIDSVMGCQRGPPVAVTGVSASYVFHTPPPEVPK